MELLELAVGVIGVPVTQFLKNKLSLEGKAAQWLAFGVALLLAVGVAFYEGTFSVMSVEEFVGSASAVFTTSFFAYRLLLKEDS